MINADAQVRLSVLRKVHDVSAESKHSSGTHLDKEMDQITILYKKLNVNIFQLVHMLLKSISMINHEIWHNII